MVQMNQFAEQKLRHRVEKNVGTPRGESGGVFGGMNWEIGIDMYTLMCIKWITNKKINK